MKENEEWMNRLKEKLENYSEPTPLSGWEQLEKRLASPVEKRIVHPFYRWVAAVAAVLLVAVSSVSIYFLHTPVAHEIRLTKVPELIGEPNNVSQPLNLKEQQTNGTSVPAKPQTVVATKRVAMITKIELSTPIIEQPTQTETTSLTSTDPQPEAVPVEEKKKETVKQVRKPSGKEKLHLPSSPSTSEKAGKWSIGAAVGNAGGVVMNGENRGMGASGSQRVNITNTEGGFVKIPDDQTVVFKSGVPYLQQANEVINIKHHQPISVGLSVRKGLTARFSIETGLTYTLLSSDVATMESDGLSQKLNYIGIPVRANWNFINKSRLTLYASAGGQIEKCVYGKLGNSKIAITPLQFSVIGAVGAQLNATKHLGIYLEPGVAYFFNDGSNVQTIRKENPFNFNLQAGVRFTY